MLKRMISLLLAAVTAFGVFSVSASALTSKDLLVFDILKVDVDPDNFICRTLDIEFQLQFCNYNDKYKLKLIDEYGAVCGYGVPRSDNVNFVDFYSVDDSFGVKLRPELEYEIFIPAGTYFTDDNMTCNDFATVMKGVSLTGSYYDFTIEDLGITSFVSTDFSANVVFKGKLCFNKKFIKSDADNCTILLQRVDTSGGKKIFTTVGKASVTELDDGCAVLSFGKSGAKIEKYKTYRFFVSYASFYDDSHELFCDDSVFGITGKRLLKMREDYPEVDRLIEMFGANSFVLTALTVILKLLSKLKLYDAEKAEDIKNYIDLKRKNK
ncbi:MAG: hypothetical protein K6F09_04800 [Clostridiales bacterium]|nr:hypothetical protein [Clostridiales bacterium]